MRLFEVDLSELSLGGPAPGSTTLGAGSPSTNPSNPTATAVGAANPQQQTDQRNALLKQIQAAEENLSNLKKQLQSLGSTP
jgi:hypothetical protein